MLDFATCLQLCCITSATLVSQEYHKSAQTSRGSEAVLQKKYRYFKNFPHFYRNPSVTSSPKTLQLCCASPQNQPSATAFAHFLDVLVHSSLHIIVFIYIYLHIKALCTLLCRFVVFPSPLLSHRKQIGAAVQWPAQQLLDKKHKKEAAAQKCATASHNSGYVIEVCSETGDHRAAFAASICLMSSGTTLNRSPTMP